MGPAPIAISSIDDPRVDVFRDVRDKDLRGSERLFMAESELVLRRLLRCPERLHAILLSPQKLRELDADLRDLPGDVPVYVADLDVMTQIAGFHIHRGVLAAGRRPAARTLAIDVALAPFRAGERCTMLVAEGVTNVDNMGGLFRNAAAFGADAIVLDPTCCDPLYRKAVRVSMGHVLAVPYAVCAAWPDDLARLKRDWGLTLIGAEVGPEAAPLWEMPRAARCAIVLGSESDGLSDAARAACDAICEIPMDARVPSINVAAASAVFLYELNRSG